MGHVVHHTQFSVQTHSLTWYMYYICYISYILQCWPICQRCQMWEDHRLSRTETQYKPIFITLYCNLYFIYTINSYLKYSIPYLEWKSKIDLESKHIWYPTTRESCVPAFMFRFRPPVPLKLPWEGRQSQICTGWIISLHLLYLSWY